MNGTAVQMLPIAKIAPDPDNERGDVGDVTELAASIKEVGLLEAITVRPEGKGYLVVFGHRRLAGVKLAGLQLVPAIVRDDLTAEQRTIARLVENLHREDLTPLQEAAGFQKLLELGLSQRRIAEKVGRSQAHVSKRLALVELPEPAVPFLASGHLTLEDAVEIAKIQDGELSLAVLASLKQHAKEGYRFDAGRQLPALRQKIELERKRAAAETKLKAEKVSILKDEPGYGSSTTMALGTGYHCLPMKASEHAKHPCHAAYIDRWSGEPKYVCTKPANHAKTEDKKVAAAVRSLTSNRSYSGSGADEAKKKAAETRQRNKELRALAPAREAGLQALLLGKPKKEQVLDFILLQLLQRVIDESRGPARIAAKWLEIPENRNGDATWSGYLGAGDEATFSDRLLKLAYAVSLAMGEEPIRMLPERGHFDSTYLVSCQRLYDHLQARAGYRAEKVELAQLKHPSNAYGWRPPIEGKPGKAEKSLPIADSGGIEEGAGEPAPSDDSREAASSPASANTTNGEVANRQGDETAAEAAERERRQRIDEARRQLEEAEIVTPAPRDPKACRICGCHGDCPDGCSWVEVDPVAGLLCDSHPAPVPA